MYKLCKTEHSAKRQRMIEDALLEMMYTRRYEDITVSDLCESVNIPRKAFYRYFDSKEGCLEALLDHRLMEYEHQAGIPQTNLSRGIWVDISFFFEFWKQQYRLMDALERSNLSGVLVQRAIAYYRSGFFPPLPANETDEEFNNLAASFVVCGMMTLVIQWHHEGYSKTAADMAAMTHRLLDQPLLGSN